MHIPFPEQVQTSVKKLSTAQPETPEALRKWWDKQIDLLLDEFNTHQGASYDNWTEYLTDFYNAAKKELAQYKTEIKKLLDLTRNQLGGMELEDAWDNVKNVDILRTVNPKAEINARFEGVHKAEARALELIKAKWRYNSNLTILENLLHYATQYEYFPSYEFAQENPAGFVSRAFDRVGRFIGSENEYFRLFPLSKEDYAEFLECENSLPTLYQNLKEKIQESDSEIKTDKQLRESTLKYITLEAELRDLDVNNAFVEWWYKNSRKIEATFRSFSLLVLKTIIPKKTLQDDDFIFLEDNLRLAYYSIMPSMEVFGGEEMMIELKIKDDDIADIVSYKQFVTKKLRALENPYELSKAKESFVNLVKNYKLNTESSESSIFSMALAAGLKGSIGGLCEQYSVIDNPIFFKKVLKEIEESQLEDEYKLDFLDFLVRIREAVLLNAIPFKEKADELREKIVGKMRNEFSVIIQEKIENLLLVNKGPEKNTSHFIWRPTLLEKNIRGLINDISVVLLLLQKMENPKERSTIVVSFLQAHEYPALLKSKILDAILAYDLDGLYLDKDVLNSYKEHSLFEVNSKAKEIFRFVENNQQLIPAYQFGVGLVEVFAAWHAEPFNNSLFQEVLAHSHMSENLKSKLIAFVMNKFVPGTFTVPLTRSGSAPSLSMEAEEDSPQERRASGGFCLRRKSASKDQSESSTRRISGDSTPSTQVATNSDSIEASAPRTSGGTKMRTLKKLSDKLRKNKQEGNLSNNTAPTPEDTGDQISAKPLETFLVVYEKCIFKIEEVANLLKPLIPSLITAYDQEKIEAIELIILVLAEHLEKIAVLEGKKISQQDPIFHYIDTLKVSLSSLGFSPALQGQPIERNDFALN
jgi:hypothetical protein